MQLLFITANRLGDAVLSTSLLGHMLDERPDARSTIVCGPAAAGVFERAPGLQRLIVMEKQRHHAHWFRLWRQVAGTRWDRIVDLRGSGLGWFLRAAERHRTHGGRRQEHRLLTLAAVLGLADPPSPRCWISDDDRARAVTLIPTGSPVIGLGPTANWDGKIWPADRLASLALSLGERLGKARMVVFGAGGEAERARAAPLLAGLPEAIDLVGRLSVAEASACLQRCALFVGNDSGLMHLAAAAGTPTLGLFGPSSPLEYAPSGPCTAVAVAAGPLGRAPIDGLAISVVSKAALRLLARRWEETGAPAAVT